MTEFFLMRDNCEALSRIHEADFFVSDSQCRRLVGLKYDKLKMSEPQICFRGFLYNEIVLARHFAFISGKRVFIDDDFSAALFNHSCVSDLEYDDIKKLVDFYVKVL